MDIHQNSDGSTAAVRRQYGGSTAAVRRQYRGSTAAVPRQYGGVSENTISPTNSPTILPGATQAVVRSRRATPPDTDNARLVRPVVTPTRSSSPPPSRRRLDTDDTYSRSSVAGEALSSYNRVHRDFADRPDTSISLSKFLKQKRIPERSFYRKKKIAELMILDRPRFDALIKKILKEERTNKINQQILSDRCGTILKQSDFSEKKRLAIAAGKIL